MKSNERTPLRRLSSICLYIWRLAIPFWLFRDAGGGTAEQRIANYRYNRARRNVLPFYLWKWVGIAICLLQLTRVLSGPVWSGGGGAASTCAAIFCMSAGIGFAFACVVIAILAASYIYLTYVSR